MTFATVGAAGLGLVAGYVVLLACRGLASMSTGTRIARTIWALLLLGGSAAVAVGIVGVGALVGFSTGAAAGLVFRAAVEHDVRSARDARMQRS